MTEQVILACGKCKRHNYSTTKNKKNVSGRMTLRKYCKFCREHVAHTETK